MSLKFINERLAERSTWAGIAAALTAATTTFVSLGVSHEIQTGLAIAITVCGVVAAITPGDNVLPGGKQ